jgi:hypothetical protein
MSIQGLGVFHSDSYVDGRTKQAFKDSTDINKILARAQQGETITHLAKHGATYGDFSDIDDLLTAAERLERGKQIFRELPGEVRREFDQNPGKFFRFVNDPANIDKLGELLPGLAKTGDQLNMSVRRTPQNQQAAPNDQPGSPPSENSQQAIQEPSSE